MGRYETRILRNTRNTQQINDNTKSSPRPSSSKCFFVIQFTKSHLHRLTKVSAGKSCSQPELPWRFKREEVKMFRFIFVSFLTRSALERIVQVDSGTHSNPCLVQHNFTSAGSICPSSTRHDTYEEPSATPVQK